MRTLQIYLMLLMVCITSQSIADDQQDHVNALTKLLENPSELSTLPSNAALKRYLATRDIDANESTIDFYRILLAAVAGAENLPVGEGAALFRKEPTDNGVLKSIWFNTSQQTFFILHSRYLEGKVELFDFENLSYDTRLHEYARLISGKSGVLIMSSYAVKRSEVLTATKDTMWERYDQLPKSITSIPILHNALIQEMSEQLIEDSADSLNNFYTEYRKRLPKHKPVILLYDYIQHSDYKRAKPYVEQLREEVGDHSWFYFVDMAKHLDKGKKKGYQAAHALLKQYPDEAMLYSTLLDHFVANNMYEDALLVVNVYYTKFDTYFSAETLTTFGESYTQFAKSEQYQQWIASKTGH